MKRKAIVLKTSADGKRAICVDAEQAKLILQYLNQDERHKKKFRFIVEIILNNLRNTELYDKEDINSKSKRVTAMKFFKGHENDRIYCLEQKLDGVLYCVICCELLKRKKTSKLSSKEKSIINKISNYEFEIDSE